MNWTHSLYLSRHTALGFMAQGIVWGSFAAYAPAIKAQIGATDATFGTVLLFGAIGAVTAMWLAPRFDRASGRFGLPIAALFLALAYQIPVRLESPQAFAAALFFVGAASGLLDVVMNARLSNIENRNNTSLMNLNHGLFSVAYATAAISAGLLRDSGTGISTTSLIAFAVIGTSCLFMSEPREDFGVENVSTPTGKPALGGAVFWGGLIVFAAFLSENAVEGWSALHIERSLGGGAAEGALGPAMLGITMAIGRLSGQALVQWFREATVVFWSSLLAASGALIAAAAPTPMVAYVGFGALGLGVSVIGPMVFALVGRRVPDDIRSLAISRVAVIGYLGFFVGPPVVGFLAELIGLPASFVFVALVLAAVPVLLMLLRRDPRID
ncbi:MFS transporter [Halocynthiibacter sp. C4]|uniref:MFS transporter n=1 Tax=Halocynthiibacter sp. C4 TaxID=2992758 RepID=UPI00237B1A82|nr:MFS transporter [Halocynthiibacter sp. C4]MDE0588588.1 MFS transporter [Halocynthiibacter sp. C4]